MPGASARGLPRQPAEPAARSAEQEKGAARTGREGQTQLHPRQVMEHLFKALFTDGAVMGKTEFAQRLFYCLSIQFYLAGKPEFNQGGLMNMLVLRRRAEEGLLIDGRIKVRILGIEGDSVKIGVEAPREVEIYRSEVLEMLEQSLQAQKDSGRGA